MIQPVLELDTLSIGYDGHPVISDLSIAIMPGEFVSLLGPSGCGKTTVLRAIAGFVPVMTGSIRLQGREITKDPAEARDVGIVFQNYALFPTMSVFENIAFGLRVARVPKPDIDRRVREIAEASGIIDHLRKKPATLSGGQQQRVAIARALVMGSQVLLFDEPLSNLDAKIRIAMRTEIKRLQRELGFTAVFVTHDQEEALSLSDRIAVLNAGRVEQIGTTRALYSHPETPFVASFIGASNEIPGPIAADLIGTADRRCFVRHEDILIGDAGLEAEIAQVDFLGPISRVDCRIGSVVVSATVPGSQTYEPGQRVRLTVRPGAEHLFVAE